MTALYTSGTISLVNGSAVITGIDTAWKTALIVGGTVHVEAEGNPLPILPDDSAGASEHPITDTEMTAAIKWQGATGTYKYALVRENTYTEAQAANSEKIAELLQRLNHPTIAAIASVQGQQDHLILLTGASTATVIPRTSLIQGIEANATVETPAGLVTYESEAAGFIVLVSNAGDERAALYFKRSATAGDWSDPAFLTGEKGDQGDIGPTGIRWAGAWNNVDAYAKNDVVRNNKSAWIALRANTNVSPPVLPTEANDDWELFARAGVDGTGTGDVIGPDGAGDLRVAVFDGITGKAIKDGGVTIQDMRTTINLCYNPGCQVWQARTSVAAMPHRTPLAVGFLYGKSGTPVAVTGERSSDVPDASVPFSMKLTVTTAATSLASDTENHIRWAIYGRKLKPYASGDIKVKFWVKSSVAGTYCVTAINETRDNHFVREYTVNVANTWEEKELTFPLGSKTGAWNLEDGYGVGFRFCLVSASGMQSSKDSWNAGNKSGTSSQVNWVATVGNTFFLTKLQISPEATGQFVLPYIEAVMSECDREYLVIKQESGGVNIALGSSPGSTSVNFDILLLRQMYNPPIISIVGALNTDVFVQSTNGGANVTVSNLQSYQRSKQVAKFSFDGTFSAGALYNLRLQTATAALVIDGHLA